MLLKSIKLIAFFNDLNYTHLKFVIQYLRNVDMVLYIVQLRLEASHKADIYNNYQTVRWMTELLVALTINQCSQLDKYVNKIISNYNKYPADVSQSLM